MNFEAGTLKQTVALDLSTSLISRAQTLNPDLSRTVEKLSARWVIEEDGRQIGNWTAASDAHVREHGLPGMEFSAF